MTKDYISIDIETTGLNPKTDRIIEIGAVKVVNGEVIDSFEQFVNPGRKISERIVELTGITNEMVLHAKEADEVMRSLLDFIAPKTVFLGHSILFDFAFLKRYCIDLQLIDSKGMGFNRKGIDTLRIARASLPELESRALTNLCNHFDISLQAHRALNDAMATHELYQILCKEFGQKEGFIELFEPRDLVYQVKRQRPITLHQKERITRFVQQYGIDFDIKIDSLTKNEADRMMDLWKLQYGK